MSFWKVRYRAPASTSGSSILPISLRPNTFSLWKIASSWRNLLIHLQQHRLKRHQRPVGKQSICPSVTGIQSTGSNSIETVGELTPRVVSSCSCFYQTIGIVPLHQGLLYNHSRSIWASLAVLLTMSIQFGRRCDACSVTKVRAACWKASP